MTGLSRYVQWIIGGFLVVALFHCRRVPEGQLSLTVTLEHIDTHEPVNQVLLQLERRVLSNGVLNGNYQLVGNGETDEEGVYRFEFDRINALDYQVLLLEEQWFEQSIWINPDDFVNADDLTLLMKATPSAQVVIRLFNATPLTPDDQIQFRTLNVPGDYATCSNAWETHTGMDVDVERECWIEADRYLPYTYRVFKNNEWTETLDSVWIDQGTEYELTIPW